ncbi:DUF2116 family Zn-ribbon domain-containing protein [Archaeoglobales archaeon]|nr:MAG: DUF2116 family Zn-ribbon domain-containing protein [Archaeoglobales archaeon]
MPGIIPHRHCVVCGKAIEPDKIYCSDECEDVMNKEKKRQRNFMIFMFAILIALFILMVLRA